MSLIRQFWLLLLGVVLLALAGSVAVNVVSERDTLETQLRSRNNDNAQSLALALSQQRGDTASMALLMTAQFDTGSYRSVLLTAADGKTIFERDAGRNTDHGASSPPSVAPGWFAGLLPIESTPGVAQVSDGWHAIGTLQVVSHASYVVDDLWRSTVRSTLWMALVAIAAGLVGTLAVNGIRRPLDATVEQARALEEGRYVTVPEPRAPELKRLTAAMNGVVQRMRALFEAQAGQLDALRRQAHGDPLTGLSHRLHFMERLGALLGREDGFAGGLVLVRLADLNGMNLLLGRESTDLALMLIARALQTYPERAPDCFAGRLNGADFALCLAAPGMAEETAFSLVSALQASLQSLAAGVCVHIGAAEIRHGQDLASLLSGVDMALARAESEGPFAVELAPDTDAEATGARGERAWRTDIVEALASERCRLMPFPVLDQQGRLVHLECPLRLQLQPGGDFMPAAHWLPLAARSRVMSGVDTKAVGLALQAITKDGLPRGVNLASASLTDGGFATHVRHLAGEAPHLLSRLWLEVDESTALSQFDAVQSFGQLLRPLGVKFGLEHAGQRLHEIERLYELGLDYVKLDASVCRGVGRSQASREFVRSTVALLHALSMSVQAEGIDDVLDADALWDCGIDAITGPWASARYD